MEMALILFNKLLSLFFIILLGFITVRSGLIKSSESRCLSLLLLYIIGPFAIMNSFKVTRTPEILKGLMLAVFFAALAHAIFIFLMRVLKKPLKLADIERGSVIYPNAGNLTIPLVNIMLGPQWVIYTCAFITVQQLLLWSHGKSVLCNEKHIDLKKVFTNLNIIAIIAGIIMFTLRIKLPSLLADSARQVGSMIGPCAMIVTGMLMANMDFKKILSGKRLWITAFLRLLFVPVCSLCIIRFSGLANLTSNGSTVLLITLIATITPSASSITNMAQVYGKNAAYASAINVATTLVCVLTMPIMVALYQF